MVSRCQDNLETRLGICGTNAPGRVANDHGVLLADSSKVHLYLIGYEYGGTLLKDAPGTRSFII